MSEGTTSPHLLHAATAGSLPSWASHGGSKLSTLEQPVMAGMEMPKEQHHILHKSCHDMFQHFHEADTLVPVLIQVPKEPKLEPMNPQDDPPGTRPSSPSPQGHSPGYLHPSLQVTSPGNKARVPSSLNPSHLPPWPRKERCCVHLHSLNHTQLTTASSRQRKGIPRKLARSPFSPAAVGSCNIIA